MHFAEDKHKVWIQGGLSLFQDFYRGPKNKSATWDILLPLEALSSELKRIWNFGNAEHACRRMFT